MKTRVLHSFKKTSFGWFFLVSQLLVPSAESSDDAEFWRDWSRLIYTYDKPLIASDRFLLSYDNFSIERELALTIEALKSDKTFVCRYPARSTFLESHGRIEPISFDHCNDLMEYLEKVPMDSMHYVFASENLDSVTSMMGHGFLVAKGEDESGVTREHTFSFFAELGGGNPLTLFYQSMVSGMDGQFMVRPYWRDLQRYSEVEEREVWDYELKLSPEELSLLKLALWELNGVRPTYLFHSFNCATLTLYAIGINDDGMEDYDILFVSPLDIVKGIHVENKVAKTAVQLPPGVGAIIAERGAVALKDLDSETLLSVKDPMRIPQDSLVTASFSHNGFNLGFLPASHLLRTASFDRNASSELTIGEVNFSSESGLEEFLLYGFKNYIPITEHSSSLSSEFYVGVSNQGIDTRKQMMGEAMWLVGQTHHFNEFQVSLLAGGGANEIGPYAATRLSVSRHFSPELKLNLYTLVKGFEGGRRWQEDVLEASMLVAGRWTVFASGTRREFGGRQHTDATIGVDFHF